MDSNAQFDYEIFFSHFAKLPNFSKFNRSEIVKFCKNQTVQNVHVLCENVSKIFLLLLNVTHSLIITDSLIIWATLFSHILKIHLFLPTSCPTSLQVGHTCPTKNFIEKSIFSISVSIYTDLLTDDLLRLLNKC